MKDETNDGFRLVSFSLVISVIEGALLIAVGWQLDVSLGLGLGVKFDGFGIRHWPNGSRLRITTIVLFRIGAAR